MPWILLSLWLFASSAVAQDPPQVRDLCASQFRMISSSHFPAPPLSEWSMDRMDLTVLPEQLLPRKFLRELEESGTVSTAFRAVNSVDPHGAGTLRGIELSIVRNQDTILSLTLARDAKQPDRFILTNFELGHPDMDPYRESFITRQALLPAEVSAHLKRQLFALAKAGGAKTIELSGPSNFIALQRARLDGFKPMDGKPATTIQAIEALYKLGRESEMIQNPQEFAEVLGTQLELSHDLKMHQALHDTWTNYQKTGNFENGPGEVLFSEGKPVAFEVPRVVDGETQTWWGVIDPIRSTPQLLEWRQLLSEGRLKMERSLE